MKRRRNKVTMSEIRTTTRDEFHTACHNAAKRMLTRLTNNGQVNIRTRVEDSTSLKSLEARREKEPKMSDYNHASTDKDDEGTLSTNHQRQSDNDSPG
jgi:hypothetical protein